MNALLSASLFLREARGHHTPHCNLSRPRVSEEEQMSLLDDGWTEVQAIGVLDVLKLKGGTPNWKPNLENSVTGVSGPTQKAPLCIASLTLMTDLQC